MTPTAARRTKKSAKAAASTPALPPKPFVAQQLVPPHEMLSEEETRRTLESLGTGAERLPKILVSDPGLKTDPNFVKAREAKEPLSGRLVRIRRPSQTAGEAVAYRILIANLGE